MSDAQTIETTGKVHHPVYVIGDIHGSLDGLRAVLVHAGLIREPDLWCGGRAHVVQCGDVVDRGPHSQECLDLLLDIRRQARRAGGRVDLLVGNHELALARGDYSISDLPQPQAMGQQLAKAIRRGVLHAARSYRQYLLTHAGVNPDLMDQLVSEIRAQGRRRVTVAAIARHLNRLLKAASQAEDFSHPMFHVGASRGGSHDSGGIFWADFDFEHTRSGGHPKVWQIFGHTPPNGDRPFRVCPDRHRVTIDVGISGHYGGYLAYVQLLPDRIVGIHCANGGFHEDILASTARRTPGPQTISGLE